MAVRIKVKIILNFILSHVFVCKNIFTISFIQINRQRFGRLYSEISVFTPEK